MIVKRHNRPPAILCDYCEQEAEYLENSTPLYGSNFGPVWRCVPCKAWVGCHPAVGKRKARPLGRLANAELRKAKIAAHAAFDRLWKGKMRKDGCSKGRARAAGYQWLSQKMDLPTAECHIGMFTVEQCARVVAACAPHLR